MRNGAIVAPFLFSSCTQWQWRECSGFEGNPGAKLDSGLDEVLGCLGVDDGTDIFVGIGRLFDDAFRFQGDAIEREVLLCCGGCWHVVGVDAANSATCSVRA